MFTGIITNIGLIIDLIDQKNKDLVVIIQIPDSKISNFQIGCSIACSGVCLTLVKKVKVEQSLQLHFQISAETISKSNVKNWKIGDVVNIENSLKVGDELGGHWVLGHVDDVVEVRNITKNNDSHIFQICAPEKLLKFICLKGSIALNGVSLTINQVEGNLFSINIIEHTIKNTNFHKLQVGDLINLEVDLMARYAGNLLQKND